jgi:hypothetical protein
MEASKVQIAMRAVLPQILEDIFTREAADGGGKESVFGSSTVTAVVCDKLAEKISGLKK